MSFPKSARLALKHSWYVRWAAALTGVVLTGLAVSCGGTNHPAVSTHNAYITLPQAGSVRLLRLNDATGVITADAQTPTVTGLTPTGLALHPTKPFLYTANSSGNSVSQYTIASDGTLTVTGAATPAGSGPREVVIDPTGSFLLVTNTLSDNIYVYSIDPGTGALTAVGSPVFANTGPTAMVMTPSGNFVYVTNPIGFVTAFSFSAGVLTPVPNSPFAADRGVSALTGTDSFLYTANTLANNVSGFQINADGSLKPLQDSPYTSAGGTGPSAIAIDPAKNIVYVTMPGSSFSIWAFKIDPNTRVLTAVSGSPFNLLSGGGLFLVMEPRGNYFYVANQTTTNIAGFQYNSGTGGTPKAITDSPFTTGTPGEMVIVP